MHSVAALFGAISVMKEEPWPDMLRVFGEPPVSQLRLAETSVEHRLLEGAVPRDVWVSEDVRPKLREPVGIIRVEDDVANCGCHNSFLLSSIGCDSAAPRWCQSRGIH